MARTIKLQIAGMHCASCEKLVAMELQEIPGVEGSKIDAQTGQGMVRAGDGVGDDQIIAAVAKAGYEGRIIPAGA